MYEFAKDQVFPEESNDSLTVCIESQWSTDYGLSVGGYAVGNEPIQELIISVNGTEAVCRQKFSRPDIEIRHPGKFVQGFNTYIPRQTVHQIRFDAGNGRKINVRSIGREPRLHGPITISKNENIVPEFIKMVNAEGHELLEIGSRAENSPGSRNLVNHGYVGFDFHDGSNVDVVGDAHKLSSYFPRGKKFGAILSESVLEHIAMPWLVAREISAMLPVAGISCHKVPYMVGLHCLPWDFFRYTVEGLKSLFCPALGFEVLKTSYYINTSVYYKEQTEGDWLHHISPFQIGFLASFIIVRKVKNVDLENFVWSADVTELGEKTYPKEKI